MRLFGVAAAAAREAAFPRGGWQPLRNKARAELALASRRAALHRVTGSYTSAAGGAAKIRPREGSRRIGELSRRPERCRPARRPRAPADKTDSSLRRRPRFTPSPRHARAGDRARALPSKTTAGQRKPRRSGGAEHPLGWAATPS